MAMARNLSCLPIFHSQALWRSGLPKVFAQSVIFGYLLLLVCIVKRVIVTGGSGFVGTHLVSLLVEQGHQLLNLDKRQPLNPAQKKFHRQVDILDAAAVSTVFDS